MHSSIRTISMLQSQDSPAILPASGFGFHWWFISLLHCTNESIEIFKMDLGIERCENEYFRDPVISIDSSNSLLLFLFRLFLKK